MALFLSVVLLALVIGAKGFLSNHGRHWSRSSTPISRRHSALASTHGKPNSYQQMLQRAKSGGSPPAPPVQQPPRVQQQQQQSPLAPAETPIPSLRGNPGGLPFNDEMYDELKYAIEKLTGRMKNDVPLTWEEVKRFKVAVDRIIIDANIPNVAFAKPQAQAQPAREGANGPVVSSFEDDEAEEVGAGNQMQESWAQNKKAEEDNIPSWLGDLAGKKSSWNVDGMSTMDTEQYYKEINNRLSNMKAKRKEMGVYEPDPTGSYLEDLNKRGR